MSHVLVGLVVQCNVKHVMFTLLKKTWVLYNEKWLDELFVYQIVNPATNMTRDLFRHRRFTS